MPATNRVLFASVNLIGDTITQTPAIRTFRKLNPRRHVTWGLQEQPGRKLFEQMSKMGVCDEVFFTAEWDRLRNLQYEGYDQMFKMNCNQAFQVGGEKKCHIAQAYGHLIDVEVFSHEILPTVPLGPGCPVPPARCMVISPNSASNDHKGDGFSGNKVAPWETWRRLIQYFKDANRIQDALFLLGPEDPNPIIPVRSERLPLEMVPAFIKLACEGGGLYAGVDNGITHIAAGLEVPCFVIYCEGISESWVSYSDFHHYRIAKCNPAHERPVNIWSKWRDRL